MQWTDHGVYNSDWRGLFQVAQDMRVTLDLILAQLNLTSDPFDQQNSAELRPNIQLQGTNLLVNRVPVPLASRPLTLKLFEIFFQRGDYKATKSAIMQHVYQQGSEVSIRKMQSNECNLNKLISRTRSFLEMALRQLPWAEQFEWLVYDHKEKVWHLVLMRSHKGAQFAHGLSERNEWV